MAAVVSVLLDPDDPVLADARASDPASRARLTRALAWAAIDGPRAVAEPMIDLLLERVLEHEGPFALAAERAQAERIDPLLAAAAAADLRAMQQIAGPISASEPGPATGPRAEVKRAVASQADWGEGVADLAAYFRAYGAGALGRHRAFRWQGWLSPVPHPDPVTLDDLVGYEAERAPLLANLEAFVAGRPANNALLYGDRGSGKSATVKALAAEFAARGLKLVEVNREALAGFHALADALTDRPGRFLLFVDDLSFEEGEVGYGALKTVLEGGVQAQPANLVIYATSNRRHLVRELRSDRQGNSEMHISETFQEKLSLADRFGIRALFTIPDQETYLHICRELARRRGVEPDEALDQAALRWCIVHNARSCRTARQFVLSL